MTDHLTTLRRRDDDRVVAWCPEHGQIGEPQRPTAQGFNAVVIEARAHDDMKHGVFRSVKGYRGALALESAEFRAGLV